MGRSKQDKPEKESRLRGKLTAGWDKLCACAGRVWGKTKAVAVKAGRQTAAGAGKCLNATRRVVAKHPISPLLYVAVAVVIAGVVTFNGTYIRAYALSVDGEEVAILADEAEWERIRASVETQAASILGEEFSYDIDASLTPVYAEPSELSDTAALENALFEDVGVYMTAYAISVNGVELGCAATDTELYQMLDDIAQPYLTEHTVRYGFMEDVRVYPIQLPANSQFDTQPIWETLTACQVEEAVYVVQKGDTFNAIAYSLGMWPNELSVLNPDVIVNKLWVGQELIIQQAVPFLSVEVVTDETYEQVIPSPVEYIETADLYVGNTKVKEQGEDGLALVNALVTYINGVEFDRQVITSETLQEPTTTYAYTGTTPRPATASNGYYIWPVRGTITSNFGGRSLWGSYDFHLGIDIACPTGTGIKAADGGTVIKSGWSGSYGYLVAIRHDNGTVTYYAHNSQLLVSVGQKVYQGQIIARSGATGNVTGPHCHFEVRINGTSVNPRNYLP